MDRIIRVADGRSERKTGNEYERRYFGEDQEAALSGRVS